MSDHTKFVPLHDRVFVRPVKREDKTAGGIIVPDVGKERPKRGEVVAAGPGRWNGEKFVETTVRAGDRVMFSKHAGQEFELGGETLLVMREDEILGMSREAAPVSTINQHDESAIGGPPQSPRVAHPFLSEPLQVAARTRAQRLCGQPVPGTDGMMTPPEACVLPAGHEGAGRWDPRDPLPFCRSARQIQEGRTTCGHVLALDQRCNRPAGHEGACFFHQPDVDAAPARSKNPAPDPGPTISSALNHDYEARERQ